MMSTKAYGRLVWLSAALAFAMTLLAPFVARASESEEESADGLALLMPNMTEFIPMIIAFIIMWIVFAKFVYPVIMGMIDKRAKTIEGDLKQAEQSKLESARALEEQEKLLEDARNEAARILTEAKTQAEATRTRIETEAQAEAKTIVERAHAAAIADQRAVAAELQSSVANISISIAGRLIGSDLSDDEHRKIIERYVEEAGSLNAG